MDRSVEMMQRYSDLFVDSKDLEVQKLWQLLGLFFAKCDGLISNAEVKLLAEELGSFPFDPYIAPVERRDLVLNRLRFLKKYNVTNPREIIRIMTWGLLGSDKINGSDRKYLAEFVESPGESFSRFAKKLGVSVSTIFEAYHRLNKKIKFRFSSSPNFPLMKLKHFIVFFKPNDSFSASSLSREFALSFNRDTFGDWMWASFLIPNQTRILREFAESLKKVSYEAFEDHRLYEIRSTAKSCNMLMFDGKDWIINEDALGIGTFKFAERTKDISPRLKEYEYGKVPMKFDAVDFLIACLRYGNARLKNYEMRDVLVQYGYKLASATVAKRLVSLKRAGLFIPYFGFYGLGLTSASTYAVECDDGVVETLYYAFPHFPECTASRTDKGVVFMVRVPAESVPAISYLMQTALREKSEHLIVVNRLENIGSRIPMAFHKFWNGDRQFWEFERGYFDLTKKLK